MNSVRDLRQTVQDFADDLQHQYGRRTPPCEILHFELDLPQTPRDDSEQIIAQNPEVDAESVKLTVEHEDLHQLLRLLIVDGMSQGMDQGQLAAHMLTIGRRIGLREAAGLLGGE